MRRTVPLELLVIGAAACGRGGAGLGDANAPMVVAVVEVTDAAPITSGAVAPPGQDRSGIGGCVFHTDIDEIEPSSASCTIYEQVSRGGRLTMPCDGADGPAAASFGDHDYRGEVRAGRLVLKHSYDFDEQDGCRWRVNGRISGNAKTGELAWAYSEEILEDDTSNCWAVCTAHTAMRITPVR